MEELLEILEEMKPGVDFKSEKQIGRASCRERV